MKKLRWLLCKVLRLYPWCRRYVYIAINKFVFYVNGVRFGKKMRVYDRTYLSISQGGCMVIGDAFKLTSGDGINPLCRNLRAKIFVEKGAVIKIGNNTGLSSPCLWAKKSITIGNNVKVGGDCIIMDSDAHNLDWRIRNSHLQSSEPSIPETETAISKEIVIEDDVLIGTRCIILKGVTIGARSIVAAGSVVSKSIPPDCIVGGNPCRLIRYL